MHTYYNEVNIKVNAFPHFHTTFHRSSYYTCKCLFLSIVKPLSNQKKSTLTIPSFHIFEVGHVSNTTYFFFGVWVSNRIFLDILPEQKYIYFPQYTIETCVLRECQYFQAGQEREGKGVKLPATPWRTDRWRHTNLSTGMSGMEKKKEITTLWPTLGGALGTYPKL